MTRKASTYADGVPIHAPAGPRGRLAPPIIAVNHSKCFAALLQELHTVPSAMSRPRPAPHPAPRAPHRGHDSAGSRAMREPAQIPYVYYGLTQPIDPTGKLLPVDVAVNPKVTLPSGGMVRL